MTISSAKNKALGPTRLAAAWVILVGGIAGLAISAILLPAPQVAPSITIDLTSTPDRYAAATVIPPEPMPVPISDEAPLAVSEGNEAAGGVEVVRQATPLPLSTAGALSLQSGALPLQPVDAPAAPETDEVVITVTGGSRENTGPARVAPLPPDPTLMAQTASGPRPAIASDGRRPFEAYRRQSVRLDTAPESSLAIMVSGLGLDDELTRKALEGLPADVTLSFAPYSKNLETYVAQARAKGHEVVIEVPMEQGNIGSDALGSAALRREHGTEANLKRLDWILSRTDAFPMVTNYLGQTFSSDADALSPVLQAIGEAGLGYLDDTGAASGIAATADVPYAAVDAVVPPGSSGVQQRIAAEAARAAGGARLVKVYAGAGGLDGVLSFVQSDARREVTLVPASAKVSQ